jgi:HD-GYP domain-containing protein (c-di-GMP phosphodiesterase class II)
VRVGCELGLKREHQVDFALLGFLHDVGMVSVEELARRAQRLERSERLTLEKHPLYSQYLLERNRDLPGFVARVAALEHERCDGSGYPNRLGGRKLSEHGHLLGLIDVYEALTHQRPFRSRVSSWQAMRMILQQQRHHFHPEAVRAFLQVVPAFPLGSRVRLSDGRCAQVTAVHAGAHSAPTVRLYQEQAGTPMHMGDAIDLRREASLYIVDTVESTVMTDPEACT